MTTPRPTPQTSSAAAARVRRFITWSALVVSAFAILFYTSNLLLTARLRSCPTTSTSTSVALSLASSAANSTSTLLTQITEPNDEDNEETGLKHIVFCIAASADFWDWRKQYIKQWWRPGKTRGVAWLERPVKTLRSENVPEIKISGNTSAFPYSHPQGSRSALRISRAVSETVRLGLPGVRWLVMGDDDTVFVIENVVRVLEKYDHRGYYYIGSTSESHVQNLLFSYAMAYGGGGFAISYPLALELEKMQDRCMFRYENLYGSDDRIHACMAELGVPLTRERGFHQYDVYGDVLGLLAAHPVVPLVSMHHLDVIDPIFPDMNRVDGIHHLFQAIELDSASIVQQSICYDKNRSWSISVSWGYVVQISRGMLSPRELEIPPRTFLNWYKRENYFAYPFNTRPVARHPCQRPFTYYMSSVRYNNARRQTVSVHERHREQPVSCRWKMPSPEIINTVVVFKKTDALRWRKSPKRDCCRVMPSGTGSTMHISVSRCEENEFPEL